MSARHPLTSLSPTPLFQLVLPPALSRIDIARARGRVRRAVSSCTRCHLHATPGCPVPFHPPSSASSPRFVVLGEAPGPEEARRGRPFIGPSGKLLRALIGEAGFDPDDDVLYANTVSCFPSAGDAGEVVRSPSEAEIGACRDNMLAQIEVANTPFVLMVGAKALGAFRSDLSITKHHGRLFVWLDKYAVMGIVHPAAVLRGQRQFKKVIAEDLRQWAGVIAEWESGGDVFKLVGDGCVRCGREGWNYDRDAVVLCEEHVGRFGDLWKKEREKWATRVEQLSF